MIEELKSIGINKIILTDNQIDEIEKYVNKCRIEKIDPMNVEYIKGLKEILGKWKGLLLKKGVNSDFLAYSLVNEIVNMDRLIMTVSEISGKLLVVDKIWFNDDHGKSRLRIGGFTKEQIKVLGKSQFIDIILTEVKGNSGKFVMSIEGEHKSDDDEEIED